MVQIAREALHESVTDPVAASMNFLNEVADRFPECISLAAGRPFDEFYAVADVERYLGVYVDYLRVQGMSEASIGQAVLQYGRTNGQLGAMITRMLEIDEGISVPAGSIMVTAGCQVARLWLIYLWMVTMFVPDMRRVRPAGITGPTMLGRVRGQMRQRPRSTGPGAPAAPLPDRFPGRDFPEMCDRTGSDDHRAARAVRRA